MTIDTITVKGRGTPVLVAIFLISLIAIAMPAWLTGTGQRLPFGNVARIWLVVALLDAALALVAVYYFSRRLTLRDDYVHLSTLFGQKTWAVDHISAVSVQREGSGGEGPAIQDYLAFWQEDKILGRINLFGVPRESLSQFLSALCGRNPRVVVAPEARLLMQNDR